MVVNIVDRVLRNAENHEEFSMNTTNMDGQSQDAVHSSAQETKILFLDEITSQPVGGKAKGLAELKRLGLQVPEAFVITGIEPGDPLPKSLKAAYERLGAGRVAVRSSALGEDGPHSSFAGQYETILNVDGMDALRAAIAACLQSLKNQRAGAYRDHQHEDVTSAMSVVVQQMIQPKSAGVLFTADPVSARRDRWIIDAVVGLGEALVSGEVTPDHIELDLAGKIRKHEIVGEEPILSADDVGELFRHARDAEAKLGQPLDMEWAFDEEGALHWLQARPITTLPADLNELDTPIGPRDVLTTGNISEMMPGAVCPLTVDVTFGSIDYGLQKMQIEVGARKSISEQPISFAQFYGHLFLNLTGNAAAAPYVLGMSAEEVGINICGHVVPELKAPPMRNIFRRLYGGFLFFRYQLRSDPIIEDFDPRLKAFTIEPMGKPKDMIRQIDELLPWTFEAEEVHLRSSTTSAVAGGILQGIITRGNQPNTEQMSEISRLLAGAKGVESALMVEELDAVVDAIHAYPEADREFGDASPEKALAWLASKAGDITEQFRSFLERHGHRSYRETCLREKDWAEDPIPLIKSMQATLRGRSVNGPRASKPVNAIDLQKVGFFVRWLLPKVHNAIRRRERTKSMIAKVTSIFGRAYRHLGRLLEAESLLPDSDLVFFFTHKELLRFVEDPDPSLTEQALQRRRALDYQNRLRMPALCVGKPEPVEPEPVSMSENTLIGRPVSSGRVTAPCRVAHTPEEAASLQPGEILIAPITDVGWTPYFSLISGLATDVGSSVSHGAVVAREYGLPAVVNLKVGTQRFQTGDIVCLDGDRGELSWVGPPETV